MFTKKEVYYTKRCPEVYFNGKGEINFVIVHEISKEKKNRRIVD